MFNLKPSAMLIVCGRGLDLTLREFEKRERMLDVLMSYTALLSTLMRRICHCPSIFHGLNQNLRSCNETS